MAGELRDDGTMDTVIACPECGEEDRYNWDGEHTEGCPFHLPPHTKCTCYLDFVKWAIADFDEIHDCSEETGEW